MELPVIQDIPKCRAWAAQRREQCEVSRSGASAVDAAAGRDVSASRGGAARVLAGGDRGF